MGFYDDMMNEVSNQADKNFNFEPMYRSSFEPSSNADSLPQIKPITGLAAAGSSGNPMDLANCAQFNIQVSRPTRAITSTALPFALFGYQESFNLYKTVISAVLPAGVTFTSYTTDGITTTFTYTQGMNVDTVTITCQEYEYPALLFTSSMDRFRVNYLRMTLSDANQVSQFSQKISLVKRNIFGVQEQNTITPSSSKSPNQYQTGIVDVPTAFNVGKSLTFVSKIIDAGAVNFSVTYTVFVPKIVTLD